MAFVETHAHIYADEFTADTEEVIKRACAAGADKIFLPAENISSLSPILRLSDSHPGSCYPMIGLHPEEIVDRTPDDCAAELDRMEEMLSSPAAPYLAVGEVGIDLHFRRDNLPLPRSVFTRQVEWAARFQLPLMIHARDAREEMLEALDDSGGRELSGVFHCFSDDESSALALLGHHPRFMLGIGGIVTFRNTRLRDVLRSAVPIERIVLETDCPYMAPVPMRGRRNEPAFIPYIAATLAGVYDMSVEDVYRITSANARATFPKAWNN